MADGLRSRKQGSVEHVQQGRPEEKVNNSRMLKITVSKVNEKFEVLPGSARVLW